MHRRLLLLAAGSAIVAAGCGGTLPSSGPGISTGGGGGGGGGNNPGLSEVWMQNTAFNPPSRNVASGNSITWTNKDGLVHNVTSSVIPAGATAFVSGNLSQNQAFAVSFVVPGTYSYFCSIHGTATTGMTGTITVN